MRCQKVSESWHLWCHDQQMDQSRLALGTLSHHGLKYESDCVSIGVGIKIWIVEGFARDCFVEFLSSTPQSNQNILTVPEQVFIPAMSHMKIANVCIGTIHQNMRIALQFSYQFAIFISVCNSHVLVYSSYVDVCNFHISLQVSFEFAIFISVCNSHVTTLELTYVALHGFYVTMTLNSLTPRQPRFSMEDNVLSWKRARILN